MCENKLLWKAMNIPTINEEDETLTAAVNYSSTTTCFNESSSKSPKLTKKPGKKLANRLKNVLIKSHRHSLAVGEELTCTTIIPNTSSITENYISNSNVSPEGSTLDPVDKMRKNLYTSSDYRQKLHELILQRLLGNNYNLLTIVPSEYQTNEISSSAQNWNGQFAKGSEEKKLLKKLQYKANLTKLDVNLINLEVFIEIQFKLNHQLSPNVICLIVDKLILLLNGNASNTTSQPEIHQNLLPSKCWNTMGSLISRLTNELIQNKSKIFKALNSQQSIQNIISILNHIQRKNEPVLTSKFKFSMEELVFELLKEADKWFNDEYSQVKNMKQLQPIENMANFVSTLLKELQMRKDYLSTVFEGININLFNILYSVWDEQFAEILGPILRDSSLYLKTIDTQNIIPIDNKDFIVEENAFKLFIILSDFAKIGIGAAQGTTSTNSKSNLLSIVKSYHNLFLPFVIQWLNLTCLKNLSRIDTAIKLDHLQPITESSRTSSSAVDVSELLMKTNDFWEQLAWPVPEESYSFVIVIIKNLDRCIHHFTKLSWQRVCELEKSEFENFEISDELYLVLNNIEKVNKHAELIIQKLDVPKLIKSLQTSKLHDNQFSSTVPALIENMRQTVHGDVLDIITSTWKNNMEHMFLTLLNHCAETKSITDFLFEKTKILSHFSGILCRMKSQLSKQNIDSLQANIWENTILTFENYLETCIEAEKTPLTFQHLQIILFDLEKIFVSNGQDSIKSCDRLLKLKSCMRLHGSSSIDLQIEYLTIRFREQCNADKVVAGDDEQNKIGRLGIMTYYSQDSQKLYLEILHGVLHKDVSESYVKVQLITRNEKEDLCYYYTEVKKSNFPLYEKQFNIDITREDWSSGGMLRFWIKKRRILHPTPRIIGEAVYPIESIPILNISAPHQSSDGNGNTNTNINVPSASQTIKLTLTKPIESPLKCEILDLLQNRKMDEKAYKFVRRERRRRFVQNFV